MRGFIRTKREVLLLFILTLRGPILFHGFMTIKISKKGDPR